MKNKKLVFVSLVLIVIIFVGLAFFYKGGFQSKKTSISNTNELLVKPYSMKYGENGKNIYIVEFVDPECESCAIFNKVIRKLYKDYDKDIQIVVRYLANHKNSAYTIKILEASREQNKYSEVLDVIFEKLDLWSGHSNTKPNLELLWQFLSSIPNLDIKKLKNDMNNPKFDEIISTDAVDARKLGVRGTPTIFVNGVELKTLSSKELFDLVEAEIYK